MNHRVQIPRQHWTPFRNEVFAEKLGELKHNRAAALYLFLYDKAYHQPSKSVSATLHQLSAWLNIDERVIRKCLEELREEGLIRRVREGVPRSRTNLDSWQVPLASFDLSAQQWTPIPRVLIQKYMPAFTGAPLLPMLLYHQHLSWNNFCWVGVTTLSKRLNWSATRVNGLSAYHVRPGQMVFTSSRSATTPETSKERESTPEPPLQGSRRLLRPQPEKANCSDVHSVPAGILPIGLRTAPLTNLTRSSPPFSVKAGVLWSYLT